MQHFNDEELRLLHLYGPAVSKRQLAADIAGAMPDVYDPDMLAAMRGTLDKLALISEDAYIKHIISAAP